MSKETEEIKETMQDLSVTYQKMRDKLISDRAKLDILTEILDYSYESGIELTDIRQFISEKIEEL